jgi:hypothetical protein
VHSTWETSLSGRSPLLLLVREVLRARESVVKRRIALRLSNAFNECIQKTSWQRRTFVAIGKKMRTRKCLKRVSIEGWKVRDIQNLLAIWILFVHLLEGKLTFIKKYNIMSRMLFLRYLVIIFSLKPNITTTGEIFMLSQTRDWNRL